MQSIYNMKRVLVLGSGGREHAFVYALSKSPLLDKLYCAPGNPGTALLAENVPLKISDFKAIASLIKDENIDIVVVGPENPLVDGLRDYLEEEGILERTIFVGPGRDGAQLEGSKEFAKEFMKRWSVPTAAYNTYSKEGIGDAFNFLETLSPPYVLKADGLAAGKGVVIPETIEEARRELSEMMNGKFGKAGDRVVIEEFLKGIELSVFVLTDGKNYLMLPSAKDYKRVGEGDKGANTGGMGAVSPVPFANDAFMKKVEERIVKPTLKGLSEEGINYCGFIFIGLMNCKGDPYVIEYNVRMGDPETEAVLPRIKSDLLAHFIAMGEGKLNSEKIEISEESSLAVVTVSGGYPEDYRKGVAISIENGITSTLFHSGTALENGALVTSGGRVMVVSALGGEIRSASEKAYRDVKKISFEGMFYRRDLGEDLLKYRD